MAKPTGLVQGTLDMLILKTLLAEARHGWAPAIGEGTGELDAPLRPGQSGGPGGMTCERSTTPARPVAFPAAKSRGRTARRASIPSRRTRKGKRRRRVDARGPAGSGPRHGRNRSISGGLSSQARSQLLGRSLARRKVCAPFLHPGPCLFPVGDPYRTRTQTVWCWCGKPSKKNLISTAALRRPISSTPGADAQLSIRRRVHQYILRCWRRR